MSQLGTTKASRRGMAPAAVRPARAALLAQQEELAQSDEFERIVEGEFPGAASLLSSGLSRREFLRIMGASLALAGLGACAERPTEQIVPYVQPPEERTAGETFSITPVHSHWQELRPGFWSRAMKAGRSKLKATRSIRRVWVAPTHLSKHRF